eukprot:g6655.t1
MQATSARRLNKKTEDQLCEAYVTLGRLTHVKACHGETTELMVQSLADAGAGDAVELAMTKVRFKYETLKQNLEKLYRNSMADLHKHRVTVEAPTRARVELVMGQQKAVGNAENELKAIMANPDEEVVERELPQTLRRANRTLKASIKLIGLRLPQVKPVTAADFPPGRLHNVTIAPKQSGQRAFVQAELRTRTTGSVRKRSPSTKQPRVTLQEAGEEGEGEKRALHKRPPTPLRSPSMSSFSDDGDEPPPSQPQPPAQSLATAAAAPPGYEAPGYEVAAAAVAAGATAAAEAAEAEAEVQGAAEPRCCRNVQSSRAPVGWDEERGEKSGNVGDALLGVAKEACGHCACACRADDVWAAYRNLRKRYQALKHQADQEEVRLRIEEKRKEMQSELDTQKLEMQAELDRKRVEMEAEFEAKKRAMHAEFDAKDVEAEAAAPPAAALDGVLALSKAEVQSLREIVSASVEESKAMQRESDELRQRVAFGEECLQEALKETLSLRDEVAKRKQHGEVLLARIRVLKGQTSAYVNNTDRSTGDEEWGWMGTAAGVRPQSDYRRDPAVDSTPRRSEPNGGAREPNAATCRQRPARLDSQPGVSEDGASRYFACPPSPSEASSHADGGYQSPPEPEAAATHRQRPRRFDSGIGACENDVLRHPAFARSPSTAGYQTPPGGLPRARGVDNGWIEGDSTDGTVSEPWTDCDEDGVGGEENGDTKAMRLERERENLTREVYKLSAELEASGVTSTSSRLEPSDFDEDPSSTSFPTLAPVAANAPAPSARRSRRRDEAAAAAAAAEEAAAVAVAAAGRLSGTKGATSRRDERLRGQRAVGGDDDGHVGNERNRHRNHRENGVSSRSRRRWASSPSMSLPDASVHGSDWYSTLSGTDSRSESDGSSRQSALAAETAMFSSPLQPERQWRERSKEAAVANASRAPRRPLEATQLWGRGRGSSSGLDTASDKDQSFLSDDSGGESSETSSSRFSGSMW